MIINNILTGHINEMLNKHKDLYESRMEICKKCPLYKETFIKNWFGPICNNKLYINPTTNEISTEPKLDYIKGCSCRLEAKTRVIEESCPANKW